jgi:hypothetical protein
MKVQAPSARARHVNKYVECICGEDIHYVELPPDVARDSGVDGIWCHAITGNWRCYDDDDGRGTPARSGRTESHD